jgi:predicted NodU family carbamoyl transferase
VCLVVDGAVHAAAQEERFSRREHDGTLPIAALACCLESGGIASASEIDAVAFHESPHEEWLRTVLPGFSGRVIVVTNAAPELWTEASPPGAAAAIRVALTVGREDTALAHEALPVTAALGPCYSSAEIRELLDRFDLPYESFSDAAVAIARLLADGNIVGVMRGRMEFGDVSLGHRSLVAIAGGGEASRRVEAIAGEVGLGPAAHHTRGSYLERIETALQSVASGASIAHAPFRAAGEPTVCSPIDAYRCMMRGSIDAIVLEDIRVLRREQPPWRDATPGS